MSSGSTFLFHSCYLRPNQSQQLTSTKLQQTPADLPVGIFLPAIHPTHINVFRFPKYITFIKSLSYLKMERFLTASHKVQPPLAHFHGLPLIGPSLSSQETGYSSHLLNLEYMGPWSLLTPYFSNKNNFSPTYSYSNHTYLPTLQNSLRSGILSYVFSIAIKEEDILHIPHLLIKGYNLISKENKDDVSNQNFKETT